MKKIMVVDDNVTNLNVARKALGDNYEIFPMLDGKKALKTITKITPDLILLDVEMPEMDGFEVIAKIKSMGHPYNNIPIIFVTAKDDKTSEYDGFKLGAVDYIIKPFSFQLLLKRVEVHLNISLQQKQLTNANQNLENMYESQNETIKNLHYSIVHVISDAVEGYDDKTKEHLKKTNEYLSVMIKKAKEMNIYTDELENIDIDLLVQISKLHNLSEVSTSKDNLTDEFEKMKSQSKNGENVIINTFETIEQLTPTNKAELLDKCNEPKMSINNKLMAIVCVYNTLISSENTKKYYTHQEAVKLICDSTTLHFDAKWIEVFKEVTDEFEYISKK